MDFITPEMPKEVERYLAQYDDLFVRREQRGNFRIYIAGMLSETLHKNVQQIMGKVIEGNYQSGHHFLADAPWSSEEINERRLQLWQQDERTRMNAAGWWVQDDTGQRRRVRGHENENKEERLTGGSDGAARQYIGNIGKVDEGLVFVSTHYVDQGKRVAIKADLYWPAESRKRLPETELTKERQRDKIDIALDQLRWANNDERIAGPKPRRVLADVWYGSSPRYLNAVNDELKWKYAVKIRSNRKIFCRLPTERGNPEHRAAEVIPFMKTNDFEKVLVKCSDGQEKTKWVAELNLKFNLKVKSLTHRPRMFLCVDDPSQINPEEAEFFLSNDKKMSAAEVVQTYSLRNWEEVFYRQGKDQLGLDQCEAQLEERLLRHWVLVMVAWTMVECFRVRGELTKRGQKPNAGFDSVLRLLRDVFRWEFWLVWLQDTEHFKRFVEWFSITRGLRVSFVPT